MSTHRLEDHDFVALSKKATKRRVNQRLLILAHLQTGRTIKEAAQALFVGERVVLRCLQNFTTHGLPGLEDKPRKGRPTLLAEVHHEALKVLIEESHNSGKGGRLTGQDIADLIQRKWQVNYTVNGIYELLKSLGMSWVSSRSKHPKQDQERQDHFKKTL